MQIDLSIVIVTFNSGDHIGGCLQSIADLTEGLIYEIIIVDNASSDRTESIIKENFPSVTWIQTGSNLGFTAAANIGMKRSVGEYLLLLNPDTQLMNNALFLMVDFLRDHPEAGTVGGLLMKDESTAGVSYNTIFPSATQVFLDATGISRLLPHIIPSLAVTPNPEDEQFKQVAGITGADLMVRRLALERIGFLDERFFMFTQETDWCFRLTQETELQAYFLPSARIQHILGASVGPRSVDRARMNLKDDFRFIRKHYGLINLIFARLIRIGVHSIKFVVSLLRYGLDSRKRHYWKNEMYYYATILRVSCLPDRMTPYLRE